MPDAVVKAFGILKRAAAKVLPIGKAGSDAAMHDALRCTCGDCDHHGAHAETLPAQPRPTLDPHNLSPTLDFW